MFERFTDRARRVVVLAQEEARMLNHNYIGTEHILLGLIAEGEGVGAVALQQLGVELPAVRNAIGEIIGTSTAPVPNGHIPFTPRSKKVLELALREAVQLGHNYIGTEHILLGLIAEGEGVGAQILIRRGLTLSGVRTTVIQILTNPEIVRQLRATQGRPQPSDRFSPGLRHALDAAAALASDAPVIGSHHVLSVFAGWDDLAASSVLDAGGFDRARLDVPIAAWDVAGTRDETAEQWGARVTEVSTDEDALVIRVTDPALRAQIAQALDQGRESQVQAALGQYLNAFRLASSMGEAGNAPEATAAGGEEHDEEHRGADEDDGGS